MGGLHQLHRAHRAVGPQLELDDDVAVDALVARGLGVVGGSVEDQAGFAILGELRGRGLIGSHRCRIVGLHRGVGHVDVGHVGVGDLFVGHRRRRGSFGGGPGGALGLVLLGLQWQRSQHHRE